MWGSRWTCAIAFLLVAAGQQAQARCSIDLFANIVCTNERPRTEIVPVADPVVTASPAASSCGPNEVENGETDDAADDPDDDSGAPSDSDRRPGPAAGMPVPPLVPSGMIHEVSTDAELREALSKLAAGDTLLLKSGATFHGPVEITASGTAANWIQIGSLGEAAIVGGDPVVRLTRVQYVRVQGFEVADGRQGIRIEQNSSHLELFAMDVHDNERDGVWIGKNSNNVLVKGGSMHHNGTIDAAPATSRAGMMNLGHGVLIAKGAHDNVIDGVELAFNAEDGVQFGPEAGSGNLVVNNAIHGNEEDGIDVKNGNQTFVNNAIHDNNNNGILLHRNGGYSVLIGNVIETRDDGNALEVGRNSQVRSEGNTYTGHQSASVEITADSRGTSEFKNDIVVGAVKKAGSAAFADVTYR